MAVVCFRPLFGGQADAVRLEPLKFTCRVDSQSAPRLRGLAHEAAERLLGLDVPVSLYDSQRGGEGMNAHLVYL